jgi:translocation and assembly module TamB
MPRVRGAARALVACAIVVLAIAAAVPLSLRFPPVRRVVATRVNRLLASTFAGTVTIDRIGSLALNHIDGVDAHVADPTGRIVLRVEGTSARLSTWALVRSAIAKRGEIVVDLPELSFTRVDAILDPDDSGALRIARAFELRPDPTRSDAPGRGVRVTLPRMLLAHATVHLQAGAAAVDTAAVEMDNAEVGVRFAEGTLAVDLGRAPVVVRGIPGGVASHGLVEAHLTQPSLRVRALWDGSVGAIGERANLAYEDGHIDGVLDVAPARPEDMGAVWPDCPISVTTGLHIEGHGTLPHVDVSAHATLGTAMLDVIGAVVVRPEPKAALHFEGAGVDVHAVLPAAPASHISASGDVEVTAKPSGAVDGHATVVLLGGTLGSARIPQAALAGDFARSIAGEVTAHAELTLREPGARGVVELQLTPKEGASVLAFEGDANAARLDELAPLYRLATGSANVHATGAIDFGTETLDARLSAAFGNLVARDASVQSARVRAHATGPLRSPSVDLAIDAEGLERDGVRLSAIRAEGRVTADGGLALHDIRLDIAGDGAPMHARSSLVRISGDTLGVNDAVVEGLGAPLTATLMVSQSAGVVRAKCDALDLARIASFAGVSGMHGKLALDVDASIGRGSARGRIAVDLQHAAFSGIGDASAQIEAAVDGRRASGHATARIEDIGTIELHSTSVNVGDGALLTASPWRNAWGAVEFDARVDLARLVARLPAKALPLDSVLGTLELRGKASRDSHDDATPGIEIVAHTTGLVLAGRSPPSVREQSSRADGIPVAAHTWRIAGIDPTLSLTVDGDTGSTALQAQMGDAAGTMVAIDARSNAVPYAILFSDESPLAALGKMPFEARISIPPRPLDSLPPEWGLGSMGGKLQANLTWKGSVLSPTIGATASLTGGNLNPSVVSLPLDLTVGARYDGARVDAAVKAMSRRGQVLDATVTVVAHAQDLLAGLSGESIPWTASARAKLDRLPLHSIALLDDGQVRGNVSGQVSIDGLHEDARASLALDFDGLEVGGVPCRSSSVRMTTDGRILDASARLDQNDGFMEARARVGVRWGSANAPTIDVSQTAETSLEAKQFRAAFLLPFVTKWMGDLDGRIDADVHAQFAGGGTTVRPEGTIAFEGGTFELTSFGGPFHGASAKLTLTPDGVIRLQDVTARGVSGSIRAAASARFDGVSVGGVRASLRIPSKDPLPLVFDGVQLGMLDGDFEVAVDRAGPTQGLDVVVDVAAAHVELPTGASSLDVQSLGDVEGVKVGLRPGGGPFIEAPLDSSQANADERSGARRSPVHIAVRLRDMQVSRGTDLAVRLEGQPTIAMTDETRVSGQIRMLRGSIDVLGKPFAIDRGTVTFVGNDATNPQIVLAASWTAPDLTHLYADFVGPLKTGKVRLRSEPSKSQSEILALILFGATDEQSASPMATAAGGAATQPLNRALGGVDRALENLGLAGGITTKIDTSQTYPRPEVEVQVARDISLQIAWVLGVPPPGTNPDSTLVTLNWHFLRQWSLETTVGDFGTSIVDVVWQHRY